MSEYIEKEAVLKLIKDFSKKADENNKFMLADLACEVENMPYFIKGELETTLEVSENE